MDAIYLSGDGSDYHEREEKRNRGLNDGLWLGVGFMLIKCLKSTEEVTIYTQGWKWFGQANL
jgi:hypothetical protein